MRVSSIINADIKKVKKYLNYPLQYYDSNLELSLLHILLFRPLRKIESIVNDIGKIWLLLYSCDCIIYNYSNLQSFIHAFTVIYTPINCNIIKSITEYRILNNNTNPTKQQLLCHLRYIRSFVHYFKLKQHGGCVTPNLKYLSVEVQIKPTTCFVCQNTIEKSSLVYQMPCCNQVVHKLKEECLGDTNIETWLKSRNNCPVCNQEVVIIKPTNANIINKDILGKRKR